MDNLAEIDELLNKLSLPPLDQIEPDPAKRAAVAEKLAAEFLAVAEADHSGDRGGYKVRIGNIHAQLSRSAWPLLELGGKLTFAAMKHSGIAAGEAVFTFFMKARNLVGMLDETERSLYESVAAVSKRKQAKVLIEPGASAKDLENYFNSRDWEPPANVSSILENMANKGVLKAETYQAVAFYQVVF